jgi:diketogulonate reductase-like aldo/keto reductase
MVVKSFKRNRLKDNMEIFDWELTSEDRCKISQILQHKRVTISGILSSNGVSSVDLAELEIVEM